jgi:hypothetical protein
MEENKIIIYQTDDGQTFIRTLEKIGIESLMRKGVLYSGKPLVTSAKLYNGQIEIGNKCWLTIPTLTKDKLKALKIVSASMCLNLEVIQQPNQSKEAELEFKKS